MPVAKKRRSFSRILTRKFFLFLVACVVFIQECKRLNLRSEFATNQKAAKRTKPGIPADLSQVGTPKAVLQASPRRSGREMSFYDTYKKCGRNFIASCDLMIQIRLCEDATRLPWRRNPHSSCGFAMLISPLADMNIKSLLFRVLALIHHWALLHCLLDEPPNSRPFTSPFPLGIRN